LAGEGSGAVRWYLRAARTVRLAGCAPAPPGPTIRVRPKPGRKCRAAS